MQAQLERRLLHLEGQKRDMLARLGSFPEVKLLFKSMPQAWSAVEILDHLQKTEQAILQEVSRNLPVVHKTGTKDWLGALFLTTLFVLPSRVKAPGSVPAIMPGSTLKLTAIQQDWETTRQGWTHMLEDFPAASIHFGVFRHPVSGWMTMPQALRFLSVHILHHRYQLDRLDAALRKTAKT